MAKRSTALRKYISYTVYGLRTYFLKQEAPYLFILVINDQCNLNCFYCESKNTGKYNLSYSAITDHLKNAYKRGHRSLVVTGGEPMLFSEKVRPEKDKSEKIKHRLVTIHSVVSAARKIGFYDIVVFTNGTFPLTASADRYIVSVDGDRTTHNTIRSNTYDRIIENVKKADADVMASITITKENRKMLKKTIESISLLGIFKRITFNFLTHFPKIVERHGVTESEKKAVLNELLSFKKQKYPILLSNATYTALYTNTWKRPLKQIELVAGNKLYTCCRDVVNPEICKQCGYSSCVELSQVFAGKPSAIFEIIKTL